jgi:hypothetical protein
MLGGYTFHLPLQCSDVQVDYMVNDQRTCLGHGHQPDSAVSKHLTAADNGAVLRITPFARVVTPPPMSAVMLPCPAPINQLAFMTGGRTDAILAWLNTHQLCFFVPPPPPVGPLSTTRAAAIAYTAPQLTATLDLSTVTTTWTLDPARLRQFVWLNATSLVCVHAGATSPTAASAATDTLVEITFAAPGVPLTVAHADTASVAPCSLAIAAVATFPLHTRVLRLNIPAEHEHVLVQTIDGEISTFLSSTHRHGPTLDPLCSFPAPCPTFTAITFFEPKVRVI